MEPAGRSDALLQIRLNAAREVQTRARVALLITSLACGAILAAEWNSYLSWDRQWAEREFQSKHWGQNELLLQQIKSWVDTNAVNLALVGLRVSVSDAAVLGSGILLVLAFYVCMTAKQENGEVGTTLRQALDAQPDVRQLAYEHFRTSAVFNQVGGREAPIDDLYEERPDAAIPLATSTHTVLIYLPALTIATIVLSDVYFAMVYHSPWSGTELPGFSHLEHQYQIQLIAMDIFAVLVGTVVLRLCWLARRYQRATQRVIAQFGETSAGLAKPKMPAEPSSTA